jgi:hypothetical protein
MRTTDYSVEAAAIIDDIIGRSDGDLGPEDRDPLRTAIRIAFELQEFLTSHPDDADVLDWTQDTILSGCDSIHLARSTWQSLGLAGAFVSPAPGPHSFPTDLNDLGQQLDEALHSLQDVTSPWPERIHAVNRIARLQLLFLGATLW